MGNADTINIDEMSSVEQEVALLRYKQEMQNSIPDKLDYKFYLDWLSFNKNYLSIDDEISLALGLNPRMGAYSSSSKCRKYIEERIGDFNTRNKRTTRPIDILEIAFQYEQNLPDYILSAYKEVTEKELKYEDYSPIKQFYEEWARFPLWTLQQGILLVHGMSPKFSYSAGIMVSDDDLFRIDQNRYEKSYDLATVFVESGKLKPHKLFIMYKTEDAKFDPLDIIEWAIKNGIKPHPLLLEFTECNNSNIKTENSTVPTNLANSIPRSQFLNEISLFKDKERTSELHFLIGQVYLDLLIDKRVLPAANDVWKEIEKRFNAKNSDVIKLIKKINENTMSWLSKSYAEPDLSRKSFNDVITDIKKSVIEKLTFFIL